jgi:hypothetical protein
VLVQEVLLVSLEDVPQHDGAPAHFSAQTEQHLNTQLPDRWLGHGDSVSWPARSPDLNPPDFFLWGQLKKIVYRDLLTDMEDLTAKFHAAVATIDADMLRRVQASVQRRAVACWRLHGGQLNTYCNYHPLSYVSAVFCVGKRCTLLKCLS